MNIKSKTILAAPLVLAILLSACDAGSASAQRIQELGGEVASGVSRTGAQINENCPTPAPGESDQAVVNAAEPDLLVSGEEVEGIPNPAERDGNLDRVNRSPERPAEGREVTAPGPGSETNLPSSQGEIPLDDTLGDVNKGIDREDDGTPVETDIFASLMAFLQQLFGAVSVSSASGGAQVERIPCP